MDDIVGAMINKFQNQRSAFFSLLRDIAPRKRLTIVDVREYVKAVHMLETGHPCEVPEVEETLDWTRDRLYSDTKYEYRRYLARVENTERDYWVSVTLWREDGSLTDAGVDYRGPAKT